jgi:hypothetical protein
MAGGIIQIATYGSEDIFLTGNPQISFFKTIYRRYTNFSIDTVFQSFTGNAEFGGALNCNIDKMGDLIHRLTLVIDLPKVNLIKHDQDKLNQLQLKQKYLASIEFNKLLNTYFSASTIKAKELSDLLIVSNISLQYIVSLINNPSWYSPITLSYTAVGEWIATDSRFSYFELNRWNTLEQLKITNLIKQLDYNINFQTQKYRHLPKIESDLLIKKYLFNFLQHEYYPFLQTFQKPFADIYFNTHKQINNQEERYPFAWVERIGQSIVDQIAIILGTDVIDRQTGDFMIIWSDVTVLPPQKVNFNKMIGNIPELITFDETIKQEYQLLVPLYFWFNRHIGLSLPVISLRYDDIIIDLRLRTFSEMAYAQVPWAKNLIEVQDEYKIQLINVRLLVEYVFLDRAERKRFAQSTHEYLIETTQYNVLHPTGASPFVRLDLNNPCKFLVWFCQPESYRHNPDGTNKCQWNNFAPSPNEQSLDVSYIRLNSLNRTANTQDSKYFNWVQPWQCFPASPPDGLYFYSFALNPTEHQPSSTCNFSRINQIGIQLNFTEAILAYEERIYFACYTFSYNILRFMGGRGAIAYQQNL